MPKELADLQKAAMKKLAKHFKKAEAHHRGNADDDEKCENAHKAHAEHHEAKMGKAEDANHDYHKSSAAFHKSLQKMAERMKKRETEYADHYDKMAKAVEEEDNEKAFKLLEIELTDEEKQSMSKAAEVVNQTPTPAAVVATPANPTPAPAVASPAVGDFSEQLQKALDTKLQEAVTTALDRVLSSEEFNAKMDQSISGKLLEKLGSAATPSDVKTFPVARPTTTISGAQAPIPGSVDLTKVPLELQDMVKGLN